MAHGSLFQYAWNGQPYSQFAVTNHNCVQLELKRVKVLPFSTNEQWNYQWKQGSTCLGIARRSLAWPQRCHYETIFHWLYSAHYIIIGNIWSLTDWAHAVIKFFQIKNRTKTVADRRNHGCKHVQHMCEISLNCPQIFSFSPPPKNTNVCFE